MAAQITFSQLRFQRDPKGGPALGPQHGVALVESLPGVNTEWMIILPTQSKLRDANRVFPQVVGAYELALYQLSLCLQENEQLRNEVAALRQCETDIGRVALSLDLSRSAKQCQEADAV